MKRIAFTLLLLVACSNMSLAQQVTVPKRGTEGVAQFQSLEEAGLARGRKRILSVAPGRSKTRSTQEVTSESDLKDSAFAGMANSLMPMSPKQINLLRRLYDESQRAAAAPPGVPPRPTSTSLVVNLSPGATPPVIRLSSGFITSLVFLDSSGAPWPIRAYDLGNNNAFDIQFLSKSNTLLVQAKTTYRTANIAVMLQGLNTPVMITFIPGQKAVDYRVDLRIPGLGPDAKPVVSGMPGVASPVLLDVLDGIPPTGSTALKVSSIGVQAWLENNKMFVRTRYNILSPAWISTMSSADGMHAYELDPAPVLLASMHGKTLKLSVEGI